MAALFFSLLAVVVLGLGARDQLTLAAMTVRQGPRPALLIAAMISGLASIGVAVWAAGLLSSTMPAPARLMFLAFALGLAGLEMLVLRRVSRPLEPTNSLGAFAAVMLAQQLTDASRLAVLGLAVATAAPVPVALGAGTGAIALALTGWLAADQLSGGGVRARRWVGAAVLLLAAGLAARAVGAV